jgi:DNA-binding MarR family transcriptional regulator
MGLSAEKKAAYIGFFLAGAVVTRKIDRILVERGGVSMEVYDLLLALEESPDRRLRMSELADAIVLSRSGLTRMVDRLERDGLLRREACPGDRRSLYAVLTEKGLSERKRTWEIYREAIAGEFGAHVSDEEAAVLVRVFERILEGHPLGCRGREEIS